MLALRFCFFEMLGSESVKLRNSRCCLDSSVTVREFRATSKGSDQTACMRRLIWGFVGRWSHIPHCWKSHVAAHLFFCHLMFLAVFECWLAAYVELGCINFLFLSSLCWLTHLSHMESPNNINWKTRFPFLGCRVVFFIIIIEHTVTKWLKPRSDAVFCGVWSGYAPQKGC